MVFQGISRGLMVIQGSFRMVSVALLNTFQEVQGCFKLSQRTSEDFLDYCRAFLKSFIGVLVTVQGSRMGFQGVFRFGPGVSSISFERSCLPRY